MRWWSLPVGMAVILCGCSSSAPAPTQVAERLALYDNGTLSFSYPAQWKPSYYPETSDEGGLVTFLSSQLLHDPCQRAPGRLTCAWPVGRLDAGAVLIEWGTVSLPGITGPSTEGGARLTTINGHRASVLVSSSGACTPLGARSTIFVSISPVPGVSFAMTACLTGPNLAQHEQEVLTMVDSTRIRLPLPPAG
jgi:hypothetical protein